MRVVGRDVTSFRFTTLRRHLEAGQIEFRTHDDPDGLRFTIETWSRAGAPLARVAFQHLRLGKEIQLTMWAQFCLAVPEMATARRTGPVEICTRRCYPDTTPSMVVVGADRSAGSARLMRDRATSSTVIRS